MAFTREDRLKGTPGRLKDMGEELPSVTCEDGAEEITLLRKVAEAASDYLLGRSDEEFAQLNGGEESLLAVLRKAQSEYEAWWSEFHEVDCRSIPG